jgi:pyruvate dehydrogenase phosphatase
VFTSDWHPVLASKGPAGEWKGELVTEVHNGLDEGEKARVRKEHPGEEECIMGYRVIGAIMVTRGQIPVERRTYVF